MNESSDLTRAIEARGVDRLVHFTTLLNLLQMMKAGWLVSNEKVRQWCSDDVDLRDIVRINDRKRLDGRPNYINLSVQKMNDFFFRTCKRRQVEEECESKNWCLISLKPECCLTEGVLFTVGNAASRHVIQHGTRGGLEGFEAMFADKISVSRGGAVRVEHRPRELPRNETTSCQAEVLVPDRISTDMIQGIYAEDEMEARRIKGMLACQGIPLKCPVLVDKKIF